MSIQSAFDVEPPFPYLTKKILGTLPTEKDGEWYCRDCQSRVSVYMGESRVAGHDRDCPHFDDTPRGINGGGGSGM